MNLLTFQWRAVDASGATRSGSLTARGEAEALRQIAAMGLTPVRLAATAAGGGRISGKDLAHFTQQLGVLMDARIPVADGLLSIAEQEPSPAMRAVIRDVAARVESGESVAAALEAHRAVFGDVYVETVRAAEKTGTLTRAMEQLSEMLDRAQETRRQVRTALTYPCAVLGVMILGMVFLIGYVVPKFAGMFKARGVKLPALTEAMLQTGQFVQAYWFILLPAAGGAAWWLRRWLRTERGTAALESLALRVPVLRDIVRGLGVSRFVRVLGVSLSSGIGLVSALELAGRASGRAGLRRDAEALAREVEAGRPLADGLRASENLTAFTKRMLCAGETSGELPRMCQVVARHYDRECGHLTRNLTTLIEPVLVVGIAAMVLVVALSIFLPMWNMASLLG